METTMNIQRRNFVQMVSRMQKPTVRLTPEQKVAIANDCRSRFWSQVVIPVLIAEAEFMKVWDEAEERKMLKFNHGKWLKETLADFEKFRDWEKKGGSNMGVILDDYAVQMSKLLKYEMRSLYATFCSYMLDKGQKDVDFKAQIEFTVVLINLAKDLFDSYFDLYTERFGIDLRNDYLPARIAEADKSFARFADDFVKYGKNDLHPTTHYPCIKAYQEFCDKLLDEDNLDKAGLKALELNHEDEFLSKLEWEKMDFSRLKEKYKVTKA